MTNISNEELQKIRKELEDQFLQLAQDELDQMNVRPRERNSLARKVVATAEKKSPNNSREALTKAFKQEVELERQSLRRIKQENEAILTKTSAALEPVRQDLEGECLRLFSQQLELFGLSPTEQRQLAKEIVVEAEKRAVAPTGEALKNAFHWIVKAELKALDGVMEKYGLADPTERKDKHEAANELLEEGDALKKEGNREDAELMYHMARKIFTLIGNRQGEAAAYLGMADMSYGLGDFSLAESRYRLALDFFKDTKLQKLAGQIFDRLGSISYKQGKLDVARENWGHALTRYSNADMRESDQAQRLIKLLNRIDQK